MTAIFPNAQVTRGSLSEVDPDIIVPGSAFAVLEGPAKKARVVAAIAATDDPRLLEVATNPAFCTDVLKWCCEGMATTKERVTLCRIRLGRASDDETLGPIDYPEL